MTLRAALKWAQNQKWIITAPHIEVPSQPPPRERWLTRDEADRLLAAAQALHVRTFLAVCLYTAARTQAVLDLTWNRVSLDAGVIDLGSMSGGKGRAVVPITARLRPYLEAAREFATCVYVVEHGGKPVASVKTGARGFQASRRTFCATPPPRGWRWSAFRWNRSPECLGIATRE